MKSILALTFVIVAFLCTYQLVESQGGKEQPVGKGRCSKTCRTGPNCEYHYCYDHGTCINNKCTCYDGYTGKQCNSPVNPCQNGGTLLSDGTCNCPMCITGPQCQSHYCYNNGNCTNNICTSCNSGWMGDHCNTVNPCQNGGTLLSDGTCNCPMCTTGPQCQHHYCYNNGNCTNNVCTCNSGLMGDHCDIVAPCQNGELLSDGTCICPMCYAGDQCQYFICWWVQIWTGTQCNKTAQ